MFGDAHPLHPERKDLERERGNKGSTRRREFSSNEDEDQESEMLRMDYRGQIQMPESKSQMKVKAQDQKRFGI